MPTKRRNALAIALAFSAILTAVASARAASPKEADIAVLYEQRAGQKPERVTRTSFGWWEILERGNIVYVNDDVSLVMAGPLIDAKTRENLTQKRLEDLLKIDWKTLPLANAIKIVRGNGARVFATFEDPNCGFCKRLTASLADLKDSTQYVFLYPILSQDSSDKSKAVWCSKDPAAAWLALMTAGTTPSAPTPECKTPIAENLAFGQQAGVRGTPTLFFVDGSRLPGAVPIERIEARLKAAPAPR